jgi:YbgC/YbaW family acyl-CoA thioester hydrolase
MKILFEKNILIRFGDTDPQGILYFARLQDISHRCLEEYLASTPLGWAYWFSNLEFAVPIKNAQSDFSKPMRAGQKITVTLSTQKISDSSVTFLTEYHDTSTKELCAKTTSVHVFVDKKAFTKISIPEKIKNIL